MVLSFLIAFLAGYLNCISGFALYAIELQEFIYDIGVACVPALSEFLQMALQLAQHFCIGRLPATQGALALAK